MQPPSAGRIAGRARARRNSRRLLSRSSPQAHVGQRPILRREVPQLHELLTIFSMNRQ
jgi:hypothetical protein